VASSEPSTDRRHSSAGGAGAGHICIRQTRDTHQVSYFMGPLPLAPFSPVQIWGRQDQSHKARLDPTTRDSAQAPPWLLLCA